MDRRTDGRICYNGVVLTV